MRTRTIFRAYVFAGEEYRSGMRTGRRRRRMRQIGVFADELERRMDERDANAAKAKAWDAFVSWATEPDQLKYSREREWGEWMEIFTGWVGHAFPEVWPLARPPYVRDQWYIDQENKR